MSESIVAQVATEVKSELALRYCCVCNDLFAPDDEMQVLCPACEVLGIRCGCVMPWQSCAICKATEALTNNPALDLSWWGDDLYELQGDNHGYPR